MKKLLPALLIALLPCLAFSQASMVRINEFLASNTSTNTDSSGSYDDWFELYNGGSSAIDLAGWYFTDDPLNMTKYQVPPGSPGCMLPAGGFKLVWCDEDSIEGPLHINFKLSAVGEFLGISAPDFTVIDSITFGMQATDVSYGRTPDGGGAWTDFAVPTPGITNVVVGVTALTNPSTLRAYPNPVSGGILFFTEPVEGQLMDAAGRTVLQLNHAHQADLSGLPSGYYLLQTNQGHTLPIVLTP